MTESLINEWLADCADYSSSELHTFATTLSQDNEIVRALYVLLEERSKNSELVDTVCTQLFDFYRSREIELQRFTLQFVPTLIFIYLNSVAHGDIKNCRSVETLLIGLYNLEVVNKSGEAKAISFRLPSLAMLSIYHEPSSLAPASLTESAVRRFEECNSKLVSWGPLQQVETLNAQNRLKVMTALLFIYNQQLSYINKSALEQLCKVATKLVTQGFTKPGHHQRSSYGSESSFVPRLLPRIPVSNQFLLEFLHGIYFAMYNDCWYVGCQAVEDIHNRACYDAYPDVMLVTNAIRNSSTSGPSGQAGENSLGVGVALSPATATPTISKSMITNASFRTKKLPDDLDANMFDPVETKSPDEKPQLSAPPTGKRRAWLRKQIQQSMDDEENIQLKSGSSSVDNSRRESLASSHGSPSRSSPKKSREKRGENFSNQQDSSSEVHRRRKEKEKNASPGNESRLSAGARLYRVLEEQALDDIPIVAKEEGVADGKANLVSISEEHETSTTDPSRVGSIRQSKDNNKTGSKITNFSLTKKPKEKDGKSAKNGYVQGNEKDKKSGVQSASKENIKGSRAMLNNDDIDGNSGLKKRNDSETHSSVDGERHLSTDGIESVDLDSSLRHSDQEAMASSVQVSSV